MAELPTSVRRSSAEHTKSCKRKLDSAWSPRTRSAKATPARASLAAIVGQGGAIVFAQRFVKWPGQANVEVNLIATQKGGSPATCRLDGDAVDFISSRLDSEPESEPAPNPKCGQGVSGRYSRGIGFVLDQEEARRLLARNARNSDCLLPYLNGEDFDADPEQRPSRYVICFHDWDLTRARGYPESAFHRGNEGQA